MSEHTGFHNKEHYSPECYECKQSVVVGKWDKKHEVCLRCGASRTSLREMIAEGGRGNLSIVEIITGNCPSCLGAIGGNK